MNTAARAERRRLRLVDHGLQKSLLVALVVMETLMVAVAIWTLYQALGRVVDDNMYRVHFSGSVNVLSLLVSEGMPVLGYMLLLNFVALVAADRIWAFYVYGILRHLGGLMRASKLLDFSQQEPSSFNHAVLEQALLWRAAEAGRLARLRERIRALPATLPSHGCEAEQLLAALAALEKR